MSYIAQIFNGGGLEAGVNAASEVTGVSSADPVDTVINIIEQLLNVLGLAAVIVIIIAGFYLILSLGEEDRKEKAKRMIFYALIGLVVVLLARVIVGLVNYVVE